MSAIVEDIRMSFQGLVRNVFTVLGLIVAIAVLALVLPYAIGLAQTATSLATGYAGALGSSTTTTAGGTTTTIR
jgi:hypothetical protein